MDNPTNRILWWALVASLVIYVVVAHVASPPAEPDTPIVPIAAALGVVALAIVIGTLVLRRRALSGPIARGELDPSRPADRAKAFTPFVLNLVLSEAVGIYGLVLAFLSGDGAWSIPFVGVALVLLFVHRPTAPDLVPPRSGDTVGRRPDPIA